jgi:hypothetical protein
MTTRFFAHRDSWKAKNIKIKYIEEKINACTTLTTSLAKFSLVDDTDASALLEEMQSLELVLDQVQATLSKKLGSEVGSGHASLTFKGALLDNDGESSGTLAPKSANISNKSMLSSWRKLRGKNAGQANMGAAIREANRVIDGPGVKESIMMKSVPMSSLPNPKFARREPEKIAPIGSYGSYMASLARLCDAVQVLGMFFFSLLISRTHGTNRNYRCRGPSGRGSRTTLVVASACWIEAGHEACSGVLCILHLSLCASRYCTCAGQVHQERRRVGCCIADIAMIEGECERVS